MKWFKEFLYIISFTFMGEVVSKVLHLPMPGSVIGMLLLFFALYFQLVKVGEVETVSSFLLDNLSIFFLPAGVGIMVYFPVIRQSWWQLLLITIVVTACSIAVTGRIVQFVKRKYEGNRYDLTAEEEEGHVERIDE